MTTRRSPEEIEEEIAFTRERIDTQMNKLNEELSLGSIIDRIMPFTGADRDYAANRALNAVKDNPMPALLVLGGLALMAGSRAVGSRRASDMSDDAARRVRRGYDDVKRRTAKGAANLKEASADMASSIGDSAAAMAASARDAGSDLAEQAADYGQYAYDAMSEAPGAVREAGTRGARWVRKNPIPAALACVAAGAAIGTIVTAMQSAEETSRSSRPGSQARSESRAKPASRSKRSSRAKSSAATPKARTAAGKRTASKRTASKRTAKSRSSRRTPKATARGSNGSAASNTTTSTTSGS